jgi:hypothetical protein
MYTKGPWKAADRWGNFGDHNRAEPDAPVGQVSRFSFSVVDSQGFCVAHCTNALVTMSADVSEANAARIALCCNTHDELLAALEEMLADQETLKEPARNESACEKARAAIAKARGEA